MSDQQDAVTGDAGYFEWLVTCGYGMPRPLGGGRYATIARFTFTCAIITGRIGDMTGYENRWCYHDQRSAQAALDAWDGTGEPAGWHKHPATGRRRCETFGEYDADGNEVPIGALYVRE